MKQISSYVNFDGNCRDAMNFYKHCFDGDLSMLTVGESPMASQMPPESGDRIMHSTLTKNDKTLISASDMTNQEGLIRGNATSLLIECDSEEEISKLFSELSVEGKVTHQLENTFWGAKFGIVKDKFDITWLLNYEKKN